MDPVVDAHIHIFDADRFPFPPDASWRPAPDVGTRAEWLRVAAGHRITHALVVKHPRHRDHRQLIDLLSWSKGALKGIATLDPDTTDAELSALEAAGNVGQRFNVDDIDLTRWQSAEGRRFLDRIRERNWWAEILVKATSPHPVLQELLALLRRSKLRICVGHYAEPDPRLGLSQPNFVDVVRLGGDGVSVVKLSSFFRHSHLGFPYPDLDPYIEKIIAAYGYDRCTWASDWPFIRFAGHVTVEEELAALDRWIPDPKRRRTILWDAPMKAFGFTADRTLQMLS